MPVFDALPQWLRNPGFRRAFHERLANAVPLARDVPLVYVLDEVEPFARLSTAGYVLRPEAGRLQDEIFELPPAVVCYPGRLPRQLPDDRDAPRRPRGLVIALTPAFEPEQRGVVIYTSVYRELHRVKGLCPPPEDRTVSYVLDPKSRMEICPDQCFDDPPWRHYPEDASGGSWGAWLVRTLSRFGRCLWRRVRRISTPRRVARWRSALATLVAAYFRSPDEWLTGSPERPDPDGVYEAFANDPRAWTFEVRFHGDIELRHVAAWWCTSQTWQGLPDVVRQIPPSEYTNPNVVAFFSPEACRTPVGDYREIYEDEIGSLIPPREERIP